MSNYAGKVELNALLARDGEEFIFVDKLFKSSEEPDALQGATGSHMVPVSPEYYEEQKERYKDPERSPLAHTFEPENHPNKSLEEYLEECVRIDGPELLFDMSYSSKYRGAVEYYAERDFEYESVKLVECIGGGRLSRSVERDYDRVYNGVLLEAVRISETLGFDDAVSYLKDTHPTVLQGDY